MQTKRDSGCPNFDNGRIGQSPDPFRHNAEHIRQTNDLHRAAEPASVAGGDSLPPLSEDDERHLLEYPKKAQLVRDRVVGVVRGRAVVELPSRNLVGRRQD